MDTIEALRALAQRQAQELTVLKDAVTALEQSDIEAELRSLRALAGTREIELNNAGLRIGQLQKGVEMLDAQLREQMRAERASTVRAARARTELYFGEEMRKNADILSKREADCRARIGELRLKLQSRADDASRALMARVDELDGQIAAQFERERLIAADVRAEESASFEQGYQALGNLPLPPPRPTKQGRAEMMVGQRVVQVIGLLILLLGVIFGLQYTYVNLLKSDVLKGVCAFGLGLVFLLAGELMGRKDKKNPFSLGMSAGGIAILYSAAAVSYFALHIVSTPLALVLCVCITALAFLLAIRRDSQLIAIFAVVGGNLPLIAVDTGGMLYAALVYLLLLNVFTLLMATRRRWVALTFTSFGLYAVATILTLGILPTIYNFTTAAAVRIAYLALTFALYAAMSLIRPLRARTPMSADGFVLMLLNAAYHCIFMFVLLSKDAPKATGLLALFYAALFYTLALVFGRRTGDKREGAVLFYSLALLFLALFVPMQFHATWFGLAWLAEGLALALYGILARRKWYERAGYVLLGVCALRFLAADAPGGELFVWKFSAVTLALAALALTHLFVCGFRPDKAPGGRRAAGRGFVYASLAEVFAYLMYLCSFVPDRFFRLHLLAAGGAGPARFMQIVLFASCVSLLYAAAVRHIPRVRSGVTRVYSLVAAGLGVLGCLIVGAQKFQVYYVPGSGPIAFVLLALTLLSLVDACRDAAKAWGAGAQWQVIVPSAALIALVTQTSIVQYGATFNSMGLSFFYLAVALAWVIIGFLQRYKAMRVFGLVLALAAVGKLFLMDLAMLKSWQRILSYFVFGGALIGISYVYTLFARLLGSAETPVPKPGILPEAEHVPAQEE